MNKLLCMMAIVALLPACSNGTEETATTSKQILDMPSNAPVEQKVEGAKKGPVSKPVVKIDKSRSFCGSRMSLEEALEKADLILHATATNIPVGVIDRPGVLSCTGSFAMIAVMKGCFDEKEIDIAYEVVGLGQVWERRVEKDEEVIAFIIESMKKNWLRYSAVKIVPANPEIMDKVRQLWGENSGEAGKNKLLKEIPKHLQNFGGLYIRQGDKVVMAPADDIKVAKLYPTFSDKGKTLNGQRLTIMTKKSQYKISEEVRVIHVYEVMEPSHSVYMMGPLKVYGEYVDGKLVTGPLPNKWIINGMHVQSPAVTYNFEITSYRFDKPGIHTIIWKGGGWVPEQESNALTIRVTE